MENVIFIIEDQYEDWLLLSKIFNKHSVAYYPNNDASFATFAKLLVKFAKTESEEAFQLIREEIAKHSPVFFLVDKDLRNDGKIFDTTGLILKRRILDFDYPEIAMAVLTSSTTGLSNIPDRNDVQYISKDSRISLEAEIILKVFNTIGHQYETGQKKTTNTTSAKTIQQHNNLQKANENSDPKTNYLADEIEIPKFVQENTRWFIFKALPLLQMTIDISVTLIFLVLFSICILYGGYHLLQNLTFEHFEPIIAAELGFICFLPALIVFGFYVFYVHALQLYLSTSRGTRTIIDFESPSKLLLLTKRLFISSLISYLFTKIIEIIYKLPDNFDYSISTVEGKSVFLKIGLISGVIILLILFYMFLSNHKDAQHESSADHR